jgi:hypothetical protein
MSDNTISLDALNKATKGHDYVVGQSNISSLLGLSGRAAPNVREAINKVDPKALSKASGKNSPWTVSKSWLVKHTDAIHSAYEELFPRGNGGGKTGIGYGAIGDLTDALIDKISKGDAKVTNDMPVNLRDLFVEFGVADEDLPSAINSADNRGYFVGRLVKSAQRAMGENAPSVKEIEAKLLDNIVSVETKETSRKMRNDKDGEKTPYTLEYVRFSMGALTKAVKMIADADGFQEGEVLKREEIWTP